MIEQRVTLRYDAQQIPAIVQAVQGDTGRDVIFELADYEIPAGATANYYIDKPDGNAVYNSAEVISSTEILAHLTEQALAVPGRNNGQVRILSDGEVITSFDFVLEVEAFRGLMRMQSETEVNIFDEALQEAAEDAIAEIQAQTSVVTGMQNSIAPTYSSSSTYAVGDYVMYNAQLYKCNTEITTAEVWTESHWTQTNISNDLNYLKGDLHSIVDISSDDLVESAVIESERYVIISSGALGPNAAWSASSYIELIPNTTYTITKASNKAVLYALYTEKSTNGFTRGVNFNQSTGISTFTTSETEKYIRVSTETGSWQELGLYEHYLTNPSLKANVIVPTLLDKLEIVPTAVTTSNYSTVLPDANIVKNSAYKMYFSMRSSDIPAHLPISTWITNKSAMLITFGSTVGSNAGCQQLFVGENFVFWRHYTTSWQDWIALKLEVNVGSGYQVDQHFTSLTEAIVFATKYKNAVVNVYNGTFDLFNEFKSYYGSDFFDNYAANTIPRGLHLKNNVHVKCSSNSKIVFNYTGSNVNVLQQFSPINYLSDCYDGFTLENATIECSRCRYVVHDDPSDTSRAYHNRYINCKFKIDNSENESWGYESVIGGGLGRAGAITIDGCYLEAEEFMNGTDVSVHRLLSYHNDVSTDQAVNSVEIRNSYLANNGKIVVYYGGTSPVDSSVVMITNNSYGGEIEEAKSRDQDTIHNMKIIAWNNELRT